MLNQAIQIFSDIFVCSGLLIVWTFFVFWAYKVVYIQACKTAREIDKYAQKIKQESKNTEDLINEYSGFNE